MVIHLDQYCWKNMLFVRQFDEDHLIIMGLGESVPVGVDMACEANPCMEGSGAVCRGW